LQAKISPGCRATPKEEIAIEFLVICDIIKANRAGEVTFEKQEYRYAVSM
jgi:hypothetical protein